MSKTIESLRRFPPKENILDDHIANTYFYQKKHKKKARPYATNIKINYAVASAFLFAFCVFAIAPNIYRNCLNSLKEKVSNAKVINIVDGGRLDKLSIRRCTFRGYARAKSKFSDNYVILNNSRKYNWADVSVDFKFPIDLSHRSLSMSLKGKVGGERVNIVLRDAKNKSSRLRDVYLASDWKTDVLSLGEVRNDIDLSNITHLRIEYGHVGESVKEMDSPIDVTVYVKDFQILKED